MNTVKRFLYAGVTGLAALMAAGDVSAQCSMATEGYLLDWSNQIWPNGTLNRTITVNRDGTGDDPITATFAITGATARFTNQTPNINAQLTGGSGAPNDTLFLFVDFRTQPELIRINVTFSEPVHSLRLDVFDIDFNAPANGTGGYRDDINVTGAADLAGGFTIIPDVASPYFTSPPTNVAPSSVYIGPPLQPGSAAGVGQSANNQDFGNAEYRFAEPVRRVQIVYANTFITTNNPAQQLIGIHDFAFCTPRPTTVDAAKSVEIISENLDGTFICATGDPDPLASARIPGSCVEYLITVENTGLGIARDLSLSDPLGPNHIYEAVTLGGFGGVGNYTLTTPPANTNCSELDCTISVEGATLPPGGTGTIRIRATVQ